MKYKNVKTNILRKLLIEADKLFHQHIKQIDSLKHQLKLMIKERNKLKYQNQKLISIKGDYDLIKKEKNKLAKAYAKKIGVVK